LPDADACAFLRIFSDAVMAIYNVSDRREAGISFSENMSGGAAFVQPQPSRQKNAPGKSSANEMKAY
jgi:hypothetical protein